VCVKKRSDATGTPSHADMEDAQSEAKQQNDLMKALILPMEEELDHYRKLVQVGSQCRAAGGSAVTSSTHRSWKQNCEKSVKELASLDWTRCTQA